MELKNKNVGLLIVGAGGQGKVVADIAKKTGRYRRIAFLDDDQTRKVSGYETVGPVSGRTLQFSNAERAFDSLVDSEPMYEEIVVAIGDCTIRKNIQERLEKEGCTIAVLVHPSAVIADDVKIDAGSVVMANAVVNSGTVLGKGVIVNTGSTVDHDCIIGDYVHIAPGCHISGNVVIGDGVWIGVGSCIRNNIAICADCMVGAGAVVTKSITDKGTYVGLPAKRIKRGIENA